VGVPLEEIEPLSVDARGSTPYLATASDGRRLFVKALGTDERSADLMFRMYRALQPRHLGDERPFSSLRRMVEHEALVALAARDTGVRTPRFVAFATAVPNGFVLSYEAVSGRSLDRLEPSEMTDDVLRSTWEQLAILRQHHIAHRDLRLANVFFDDAGAVWIIDFGFAELSASKVLLANDLAELLASSSTRVGAERAIAAGRDAVGADTLVTAHDRLQLPMLSGATREAMKAAPGSLDELRAQLESLHPDLSRA
jgi:undecaprenyl-diphosphatase